MTDADDGTTTDGDKALEGISVAPPAPDEEAVDHAAGAGGEHPTTEVRDGLDAASHEGLSRDPSDADAKLDIELDETFPSSDAPSTTRPGTSGDPAPSSGYDEEAERERSPKP